MKELLQSENVIQVLRSHQQKVKQVKGKEIQERKFKKGQDPPESSDQGSLAYKPVELLASYLCQ